MREYKTFKETGSKVEHLNHEVQLMKTEKGVEINKVYEQIKHCTHMVINHKYISSVDHVIRLIRTWENNSIYIGYTLSAKPVMGVNFKYDDIVGITEEKTMYGDKQINVKLKDNITIKLV